MNVEAGLAQPQTPVARRSNGRIESLDALRTVMCIGIALYHFTPYFFDRSDNLYILSRHFAVFTDMFLVFAGFFLARASEQIRSYRAFFDFLKKRMARLYPLHIVTFGFYVLVGLGIKADLFTPQNSARYNFSAILPHLTLTHGWGVGPALAMNYPSWAISAIFGCYLLLPILVLLARKSNWLLLVALLPMLAVAEVIAGHISLGLSMPQGNLGFLRAIPSVTFGLLLGRVGVPTLPKKATLAMVGVMFWILFGRTAPLDGAVRLIAVYAFITSILAFDRASTSRPRLIRAMGFGAKYSFGVYLLHAVVATLLFRVTLSSVYHFNLIRFGDQHPAVSAGLLLFGVLISFIAAWISLHTIENQGAKLFVSLFDRVGRRSPIT